ncbi:MAG TPA: HAD family hydrolase [Candidatus Saccharimonadales bacterium]|nr:HAD family hydrolase [Candidatus Saccharimonadales bacterium]
MSERKIGVVLSDVDGTQIIHGQRLPAEPVQDAAHALRANGISLLEVTSRPHALMRKLVEPLDLRDNLCTLDGGATVAHADSGEVVWSQWLSAETTRAVVRSIGQLCANVHFDKASRQQLPEQVLAAVDSGELAVANAPSVFAIFEADNGPTIVEALGALSGIKHTPIMNYEDHPSLRCIQVVDSGVDKQYGIEQMLHHAQLADQRRLVIGDGWNDFSLFAAAGPDGVKVAMRNAPDELKDLADWVAPSVENYGFRYAMVRYGLI